MNAPESFNVTASGPHFGNTSVFSVLSSHTARAFTGIATHGRPQGYRRMGGAMAGMNRYQRRWSNNPTPSRSRVATAGRGVIAFSLAAAVALALYIFGFLGGAGRGTSGTLAIGTIVPPPAPLVLPTPAGEAQPFGRLPPVQPFGGESPSLTFAYERSGPFTGGATEADVFRVEWGRPTVGQVDTLARKFGLTGPVRETREGLYTVTGNGTLTVEARAMTYTPPAPLPASSVPLTDERAASSAARGWLLARDLLPADVGPVDVRFGPDVVDVIYHPKALPDLLSVTPGLRLRMGTEGTVRELTRAWPTELTPGSYTLVPLDAAWTTLPNQAVVEMRLPPGVNPSPDRAVPVLIDHVSVAYALAGSGTGADYLQPMYVFRGRATIPGVATPVIVRAAVPAVRDTQRPSG